MGTPPSQPMKCSRSWFSIPDTWYRLGRQFTLGHLVWTHDELFFYKELQVFCLKALGFSGQILKTNIASLDWSDWILQTWTKSQDCQGKTRNQFQATYLFLNYQITFVTKSCQFYFSASLILPSSVSAVALLVQASPSPLLWTRAIAFTLVFTHVALFFTL